MASEILYEDSWGEIIDRAAAGYTEIRWYDTTKAITGDQFNQWLSVFAGFVEQKQPAGALVDALAFGMSPGLMSMGWRDENIIPRYNAAGLKKFAFIMPAGMPAIGKPPAAEGPAHFPTAYFANRSLALEWLLKD